MKQSFLITLLGITLAVALPSVSNADDDDRKYKHGTKTHHKHKQRKSHHANKHANRDRNKKHHRNKHFVKNQYDHNHKRVYKKHHSKNEPQFSISWNVGDATITYGNDHYNNGYDHSYKKRYKKNSGKRIYKRINKQAKRIQRGINNGQLVRREARKLKREQRHIKQTFSHYKRDGHLNRYERSKMHKLLDVANNNIHRKSNNKRTRYSQRHDYYVQY